MVDQKASLHSKWVCLRAPQNLFLHLICPTVKLLEYPIILPHLKTDSSIQVDIRSSVSVSFRWVWGSCVSRNGGVPFLFNGETEDQPLYPLDKLYIYYGAPDFYPWLGGFEASELDISQTHIHAQCQCPCHIIYIYTYIYTMYVFVESFIPSQLSIDMTGSVELPLAIVGDRLIWTAGDL